MHPVFYEHRTYEGEHLDQLKEFVGTHPNALEGNPAYMQTPVHLGIDKDLTASYYIGADWLEREKLAAVVLPKMDNLDYTEMFIEALSVDSHAEAKYFSSCYGIRLDQPYIEVPQELNQLSILLLVQYITQLEQLVERGVRKDYITIEENLKSKIKGHLMVPAHLNRNVIPHREDRAYCRYQIYTEDIPVNRLLKKALTFAEQMLISIPSLKHKSHRLHSRLNTLKMRFESISEDVSVSEVLGMSGNKLYRHYKDAVETAQMILRRYDYSISDVSTEKHTTPPFWIDMSRLFELYVFSQLQKTYTGKLKFQVPGYGRTCADYIYIPDESVENDVPLIIDAKYKPRYDYSQSGIIADIREISGYARDRKILRHFSPTIADGDTEVGCLIVYPTLKQVDIIVDSGEDLDKEDLELLDIMKKDDAINASKPLWESARSLRGFRNFRKINIPLPTIKTITPIPCQHNHIDCP